MLRIGAGAVSIFGDTVGSGGLTCEWWEGESLLKKTFRFSDDVCKGEK